MPLPTPGSAASAETPDAGLAGLLPGLGLSAAVAGAALASNRLQWLSGHGIGALTIAIVLGMAIGNSVYHLLAERCAAGVGMAKQWLLRAGVVLYGLRLTLRDIAHVGPSVVLIDLLVLSSTFGLGWFLGTRLLGLERSTAILIATGSAICGAAAVMAAEPVVRARSEQVAVAVSAVVVFGTLGMLIYPAIYGANLHWHLLPGRPGAFGIYIGSTIHEVAQVFAAAHSIGGAAADAAMITKLVRVMMLAPFLVLLSAYLPARSGEDCVAPESSAPGGRGPGLPWFAFGFVGMVAFNTLGLLPGPVVSAAVSADDFLLAMAMAALGLTTQASSIRRAGAKPLLLGALLFLWLVAGGGGINAVVERWLHRA